MERLLMLLVGYGKETVGSIREGPAAGSVGQVMELALL